MEEQPHVHGATCLEQGCALLEEAPPAPPVRRRSRRPVVLGAAALVAAVVVAVAAGGDEEAPVREVREPVADAPAVEAAPAQDTAPGTAPDRGLDAAVEALTAPREVPAVTGGTLLEAQKALLAEQFLPQAVDGSGEGRVPVVGTSWTVVAQEPAAGTVLPPGRRVTLTVVPR